jgi:hypothetical protein
LATAAGRPLGGKVRLFPLQVGHPDAKLTALGGYRNQLLLWKAKPHILETFPVYVHNISRAAKAASWADPQCILGSADDRMFLYVELDGLYR